jgi:hypothetical protein
VDLGDAAVKFRDGLTLSGRRSFELLNTLSSPLLPCEFRLLVPGVELTPVALQA